MKTKSMYIKILKYLPICFSYFVYENTENNKQKQKVYVRDNLKK